MSDALELKRGGFMRRKKRVWEIVVVRDDVIQLKDFETGELDRLSIRDWQIETFEGHAELVVKPVEDEPSRKLMKIELRSMTKKTQAAAERCSFYVRAYRDPAEFYRKNYPDRPASERHMPRGRSRSRLKPFLRDVAHVRGEPAPGFSTFLTWLDKAARMGSDDARALAPLFANRGPQKRYMNARAEQWLNEIIDRIYLTSRQNKKKAVFTELVNRITEHNKAHPAHPVGPVGERQVYRYLSEEVDKYVELARRKGKEHADRKLKPVSIGPEATDILEIVEVDHTQADVDVCDDLTFQKLGRPWITIALDRYSRMVVGVHVHFDGPSLSAVMQALRNAMSPKHFLRATCADITYAYPCVGVPLAYFFDRGSDFDNEHVQEVGLTFNIRIDYEPVGCPQFKGGIERFNRTMAEDVAHPLPGATPPFKRGEVRRDPDGKAYITYSAFVRRLWLWIAMVYSLEIHRGIVDVPLRRWQEAEAKRPPRPLRHKDDLRILLNRVEYLVPSVKGVECEGLYWNGDVLKEICSHPGWNTRKRRTKSVFATEDEQWQNDPLGGKVKVKIDETDLSRAWVIHPVSRQAIALDPMQPTYMKGLSLYQHRMIQHDRVERAKGARDEASLIRTRHQLFREAEELLDQPTKLKKRRSHVARFLGVGARAPFGDDTGSLDVPEKIEPIPSRETMSQPAPASQSPQIKFTKRARK